MLREKKEREEAERARVEQERRMAEEWNAAVESGEIMTDLGGMGQDWLDTLMDI